MNDETGAGTPPDQTQRKRTVLVRNRDFLMLWSGESVSSLGSQIGVIVLPSLAVLYFGQSALGVGFLIALQWIPFMLLAPVVGVLTDRFRRKILMQFANIARFVILFSLPVAALTDQLTMTHLYVAALLKGVFDVVFQLSYQAFLPFLLDRDDLTDGNAKTQLSRSLALILGRSVGGGLVSALGPVRAMAVNGLGYLVSSLALLFVRKPENPPEPPEGGLRTVLVELKGGVALTFGNRLLRYLTLMATFGNMAVSLSLAMIIVFAYEDLGFSGAQVGLALGLGSAAVVIGALSSQWINERLGMGRTLIFTHVVLALAFALIPVALLGGTGFAFAVIVVSQCLSSFTTPIANVGIMTIIQKTTPPEAMGRVGGVALPFVWGSNAVGPLLGSALAVAFANWVAFVLAAVMALIAAVWVLVGAVYRVVDDVPEESRIVL
ncbi:MFS transporter [Nocardiopsis valliformis]|uniref:MFS transporter n=1 Tax=Nocardiopsis valliformis TaxID=239974 RepID=UPI00034A3C75|nr:MFS transporter [Nocardiopsis valliformis]